MVIDANRAISAYGYTAFNMRAKDGVSPITGVRRSRVNNFQVQYSGLHHKGFFMCNRGELFDTLFSRQTNCSHHRE